MAGTTEEVAAVTAQSQDPSLVLNPVLSIMAVVGIDLIITVAEAEIGPSLITAEVAVTDLHLGTLTITEAVADGMVAAIRGTGVRAPTAGGATGATAGTTEYSPT